MENIKSKVDQLVDHVEEYFETRKELITMTAIEKSSRMISTLFAALIIVAIFFLVFVFAGIALAYAISQYIGQPFSGFLIVALLYLIVGLILYAKQDRLLKSPIANAVIKTFFSDHDNE